MKCISRPELLQHMQRYEVRAIVLEYPRATAALSRFNPTLKLWGRQGEASKMLACVTWQAVQDFNHQPNEPSLFCCLFLKGRDSS